MNQLEMEARVIAFSPSFTGRDGKTVDYPKYTVRVNGELVDMPIAKDVNDPGKYLDQDVDIVCEVFPGKNRNAGLRIVMVK